MNMTDLNDALSKQAQEDRAKRSRANDRLEQSLSTLNDPSTTPRQRQDALNQWRQDIAELESLDYRNL